MSAWVGFVSVFLLGLASGMSFSHLLQGGPKRTLPPAQFLAVQQILLRNYGSAVGGLEAAALVSTLARAVVTWGEPLVPVLASVASACILGGLPRSVAPSSRMPLRFVRRRLRRGHWWTCGMSAPGRFALASRSPGFTGAREGTSRSKPWDPSNQVLCWKGEVG